MTPFDPRLPIIAAEARANPDAGIIAIKKRRRMSRKKRKGTYDRKTCLIYGLAADDGRIRYVGQTRMTLKRRLAYHFKNCHKSNSAVNRWLRGAKGVEIALLDDNGTWDVSEILWIDRLRSQGVDLLNQTRGGTDTIHSVRRETA